MTAETSQPHNPEFSQENGHPDIKNFNTDQTNAYIEQNKDMGLVGKIASGVLRAYPTVKLEYDDIFNAGIIGLFKAKKNYDPSRDASFETYARKFIYGAIMASLLESYPIKRHTRENIKKTEQYFDQNEELKRQGKQPLTEEEIAEKLKMDLQKFWEYRDLARMVHDSISYEGVSQKVIAKTKSPERLAHESGVKEILNRALEDFLKTIQIGKFRDRYRKVFKLYYRADRDLEIHKNVDVKRICLELGIKKAMFFKIKEDLRKGLKKILEARGINIQNSVWENIGSRKNKTKTTSSEEAVDKE